MLRLIRQILSLFSSTECWHLCGVGLAMLAMGVMQMLGVGIILPFVSLLSNPEHIQNSVVLSNAYDLFGFESNRNFLLFLGALLLVTLVGSNIVSALTLWLMTHFTWSVQKRISAKLLSGYLNQPYEAFLNRNSADIGKNILAESQQFATGVLMSALKVAAYGTNAVLIIGFLVWINPSVAIGVAIIFLSAYILVYLTVRRVLLNTGKRRMLANTARFKAVDEAFGSVKEVKVLGREDAFLNRYIPAAGDFATSNASNQVLSQIPRFIIEALAFSVVMGAMLYILAAGYPMQSVLPVASAFVVAGYRLLPALQNIYSGIATLRFNQSVIDTLQHDLKSYVAAGDVFNRQLSPSRSTGPMVFARKLTLDAVGYTYPGAPTASLSNVTIEIPRNSFVALTGSTGAGKTTLADIILGLLQPTTGALWVDDTKLTSENVGNWQANIGYVPQDIYLTDNTIAANIAHGIEPSEVDRDALQNAARIANIYDFVMEKLPEGFETMVGERGVRLSGGQRQRIGIARALYHDPQVIVLDEATSALDNETERRIVNELDAMRGGRTLIVIAHRLTTIQKCHKVFMLHDGQVLAQGSYDQLVRENTEFSRLARSDANFD